MSTAPNEASCGIDLIERQSDLAVAREFAKCFPTLTLTYFHALRRGDVYVVSHNVVCFEGDATEMLRLRLLDEHMLPPGRKRRVIGNFRSEGEGQGSSWGVQWLRAGRRLRANFTIQGDDEDETRCPKGTYHDDLPADHPLQMLHPRHWPFGDAGELRSYFEHTRADARLWIEDHLVELERNLAHMRQYGYSVHAADQARMREMVREFGKQLLPVFDSARIVSDQAPQLRIVDNTKENAHG